MRQKLRKIPFNCQKEGVALRELGIRKLTPKECWRLQGQATLDNGVWNDANFEKAEQVNSNAQLYRQAGNSITVDVLVHIFREMDEQGLL